MAPAMNGKSHCAVIDNVIVAKGSKAAMLKLVQKSGKTGPGTFLGNSPGGKVGDAWGRRANEGGR